MLKHSDKREAIYAALCSTTAHPSAETVYEWLHKDWPSLSLATVYRNLSLFRREGLCKCVGTVNGFERFDGDMSEHSHFICEACGEVSDLGNLCELLTSSVESGAQVNSVAVSGICAACKNGSQMGICPDDK